MKKLIQIMTAPAALAQSLVLSVVMGFIIYLYQGSLLTAALFALASLALVQVGYFAGIVYLVLKGRGR